jgi:3',5'-cyclic AMP phosphodiesterase CpdA
MINSKESAHFVLFCTLLAIVCLQPNRASAQADTLTFLHTTDTHLIFDIDDYHPEVVSRRKHYGYGIQPLRRLLDSVSTLGGIRFVAITGDLVDYYGAVTPRGVERSLQIERFGRLIREYPIPVFLNLGNHDIVAHGWDGQRMTSSQRIAGKARAAWVRSAEAFRDGTYYSRNFKVGATHYKLIFLDNGYNSAGALEPTKPPYLDRVQLEWLKEQLNESANDVEIVLMHIPFTKDASGEFFQTLTSHPSAKLILSGHEHENKVTQIGIQNTVSQVQTGAFARDTTNWRIIKLAENSILVSTPAGRQTELSLPLKK